MPQAASLAGCAPSPLSPAGADQASGDASSAAGSPQPPAAVRSMGPVQPVAPELADSIGPVHPGDPGVPEATDWIGPVHPVGPCAGSAASPQPPLAAAMGSRESGASRAIAA